MKCLILGALAGLLLGCSTSTTPTVTTGIVVPSLGPTWTILYSANVPTSFDAAGGFYFPQGVDGVHYVERGVFETGRSAITMSYRIDGDPGVQFISSQDGGAGELTLLIERAGDDLGADQPFSRFWAGSQPLALGQFSITVPLTFDRWTGVLGQSDATGFATTLANLANVGFTFGNPAAGASGHGVFVKGGSAHFTLLGYTVQ